MIFVISPSPVGKGYVWHRNAYRTYVRTSSKDKYADKSPIIIKRTLSFVLCSAAAAASPSEYTDGTPGRKHARTTTR